MSHKGYYHHRYLPHFDDPHRLQSITFRLHDSLPAQLVQELKSDPQWQSDAKKRRQVEQWLDSGYGACYLREPSIAALLQRALLHFDGERYRLIAWVVMPNHVHVLVEMQEGYPLAQVVHSWKSFVAHQANKLLNREGQFWYRDYYDRFIRNEKHFDAVVAYIHNNPVKAGLVQAATDWEFGSARRWEKLDE